MGRGHHPRGMMKTRIPADRVEIPDSLRTFDFCLAWERFKAHFDAINEIYWLHHFEIIGEQKALKEIEKELKT